MTQWSPENQIPHEAPAGMKEGQLQPSPYTPPTAEAGAEVDWSGWSPSGPQQRPWVRYWARTADTALFSTILSFIIAIVAPVLLDMHDKVFGIMTLFIYSFVEPALLATFGTTPFKALLRIRIRKDGERPGYVAGLVRSLNVWIRGQGLGIPFISILTLIASYKQLTAGGITSWDEAGDFTVEHQEVKWWNWLILIAFLIGFIYLMFFSAEA